MNTSTMLVIAVLVFMSVLLWLLVKPKRKIDLILSISRKLLGFKYETMLIDGYRWHYLDSKGDNKQSIVLLHGFGANKDNWLLYGYYLKKNYRVIMPDLPGFGDTKKDQTMDYSVASQVKRIDRFVNQLSLEKVHIVGNSMGGLIALQFALDYPNYLSSLQLMNAAGIKSKKSSQLELAVAQKNNPLLVTEFSELDKLLSITMHKSIWIPKLFKRDLFNQLSQNYDFYDKIFWALVTEPPLNEELAKIRIPVLILWGLQDQLLDVSCAHVLNEKIKHATLIIHDNDGHIPMMESPKKSAIEYLTFLHKIGS
ncbi:alpha/beta hydrolase [Alteromonas sp. M12]|uniref:alpha/beta fold hydrolase n=1 Tax=Alteromonas sp. M12 TaxID=3135644 RepID=UPI00319DDE65